MREGGDRVATRLPFVTENARLSSPPPQTDTILFQQKKKKTWRCWYSKNKTKQQQQNSYYKNKCSLKRMPPLLLGFLVVCVCVCVCVRGGGGGEGGDGQNISVYIIVYLYYTQLLCISRFFFSKNITGAKQLRPPASGLTPWLRCTWMLCNARPSVLATPPTF